MLAKNCYTHIKKLEREVLEQLASGSTQREVAEHFWFRDKYVVKEFVKRHNKRQKEQQSGITLGRKGRPPKGYEPTKLDKDNKIKRLTMEKEAVAAELQLHSDQGIQWQLSKFCVNRNSNQAENILNGA